MAEADARDMSVRMLVEFVDGSKTMAEMAAIANATGLVPDRPGMHGPSAGPDQLATTFIPQRDGGILSEIGRVDYSVGKGLAPAVFVVAEAEHPRIWQRMKDLKMGDGPYFPFIRPYHLIIAGSAADMCEGCLARKGGYGSTEPSCRRALRIGEEGTCGW